MARSRNIKPGFFKNEHLAECSYVSRLLFPGLWCLADREGRLEYRPMRIKAEIFPYDTIDVKPLMVELAECGMIFPYFSDKTLCIQIVTFKKHQSPHRDEQGSTLHAPYMHQIPDNIKQQNGLWGFEVQEKLPLDDDAPDKHDASTEHAALIPDSLLLIPDSIPDQEEGPGVDNSTEKKGDYQSKELKDVCWAIQKKTGSKQVWKKTYWPIWNRAIANIGADRLIAEIENMDFYNVEYLLREPETGRIGWIEDIEMRYMGSDWEQVKAEENVNPGVVELYADAAGDETHVGPTEEDVKAGVDHIPEGLRAIKNLMELGEANEPDDL